VIYAYREHRFRPGREQTYCGRVTLGGVRDREGIGSSDKLQSDDLSVRPHSNVGVAKLGLRRWFAKPVSLRDSWVQIPPPALSARSISAKLQRSFELAQKRRTWRAYL
jgi:hypothetical protein